MNYGDSTVERGLGAHIGRTAQIGARAYRSFPPFGPGLPRRYSADVQSKLERSLEDGWEALDGGQLKAAVRHGWQAAVTASTTNDAAALRRVIELGSAVTARTSGREAESAAKLVRFCETAIDHPRQTLTVFGLRVGEATVATKVCPDCAETVKAAAKVCRFCGYRFDGEEPAR